MSFPYLQQQQQTKKLPATNMPPSGATGLLLEPEPVVLILSLCYEPASGATRAGTGCCDIEFVILATLWRNQPATGTRTCCALILS
ncbi:unnamed protein product [Sphagnum jensenii]|uniref:Uncharacterized protein n=1 Tax=Sphagnum jensenii TaxID=128206 RepID=A0ABP0WVM1_9BRYO